MKRLLFALTLIVLMGCATKGASTGSERRVSRFSGTLQIPSNPAFLDTETDKVEFLDGKSTANEGVRIIDTRPLDKNLLVISFLKTVDRETISALSLMDLAVYRHAGTPFCWLLILVGAKRLAEGFVRFALTNRIV
jgi:hypothetical protein